MTDLIYRDIRDVLDDLPERCASRLPSTGEPIILMRGHKGYWPAPHNLNVERYNEVRGVTAAQREAMEVGSCFGFDVPGADVQNIREPFDFKTYEACF